MNNKKGFSEYIFETNADGSVKASSYIRALELLSEMLQIHHFNCENCIDIWNISSVEQLLKLKQVINTQQTKNSVWLSTGLRNSCN